MILIISNRNVNLQGKGPEIFKSCVNPVGSEDVLMATAQVTTAGDWLVNLVPTPPQGSWVRCSASCGLLGELVNRMKSGEHDDRPSGIRYDHENKTYNWIFFIPGYSSTASEGLEKARQLESEYNANVILFSWPADPPGSQRPGNLSKAYKQAQASARVSAIHLDQTLEQLGQLFAEPLQREPGRPGFRFCLLMHSLGNYLFESYIRDPVYSGETQIFDTIVMHQADVSSKRLGEWIEKVAFRDSLYITINEFDDILRYSDLINDVRAGLARGVDKKTLAKFIDFTHGRNVQAKHFMFTDLENHVIREACKRMIRGVPGGGEFNMALDGAGGFTLHQDKNMYVLNDPDLLDRPDQ